MRNEVCELLRGPTLKSEIYKTISGSKFGSIGHLLKHSAKKGVKYVEFASEGTETASDIIKPILKSNRSMKKLNSSGNDSSLSQHKLAKESSREKLAPSAQRPDRRVKACSGVGEKGRNYMLMNSQKSSKEKGKKCAPESTFPVGKTEKKQSAGKEKTALSKSKSKLSCKMNLSSIIEQSSSEEQLVTPQHKKNPLLPQEDKTAKKAQKQPISQQIRKKIAKSFSEPQKFIKLIKSESVTVSYRVLKHKLIEIEIYILRPIDQLSVSLQKGNLECQSIQETYSHLPPHTLLALFSSVRDVNILEPYRFPHLHLQVTEKSNSEGGAVSRLLTLPYTFLNFADEKEAGPRRSRIRTKLCLQGLPINPKKLKILSCVFKAWAKRQFKGEAQFQTHFHIGEHDFRLRLIEERETFTLQLEGRGEQRLTRLIDFFSKLIC